MQYFIPYSTRYLPLKVSPHSLTVQGKVGEKISVCHLTLRPYVFSSLSYHFRLSGGLDKSCMIHEIKSHTYRCNTLTSSLPPYLSLPMRLFEEEQKERGWKDVYNRNHRYIFFLLRSLFFYPPSLIKELDCL